MLEEVLSWLRSELNVFKVLGCIFDVSQSPAHGDVQSLTVDFEVNDNLCRLIFWETGTGHVEVIEIESENTLIDESFDMEVEFAKAEPFKEFAERLRA